MGYSLKSLPCPVLAMCKVSIFVLDFNFAFCHSFRIANIKTMFAYKKFLVKETDHFDASAFPQLDESLQQTLVQLAAEPSGPTTAMIVSFVKDGSVNSQLAKDHPQLANLIRSNNLSLTVMAQLFDSSKQNSAFQQDLESHITTYLNKKEI
jgi:hypothetical protein